MEIEQQTSQQSEQIINKSEDLYKTECFINVVTVDGKKYEVPRKAIMNSKVIAGMLNDDEDYDGSEIPVPEVPSYVFEKIVEFLNHFANDPIPPIDSIKNKSELEKITSFKDYITEWYWNYINNVPITQQPPEGTTCLYELANMADYLDVVELKHLCLAHLAFLIKDKEPEEQRKIMDLRCEYTPEDQKRILAMPENQWILEVSDDEDENKQNN